MVKVKSIKLLLGLCSVLSLFLTAESSSLRLPNNAVPKLYRLDFDPHIDDQNFTFDGNSSTLFEVLQPTDTVIVHASDLINIDNDHTKIVCNNGTIRKPIAQVWNSTVQQLSVKFEYALLVGEYTIEFKWKGYDTAEKKNKKGFIRQTVEVNGRLTSVISTVFEPQGARSVFPCWDEPGFKSQYLLSVKHDTRYRAISNMPIETNIPIDNETVRTIFKRSPPMSTYHLTIVVGVYDGLSNEYNNMTFWTQPGGLEYFQFSAEWTPLIVSALKNYTGIMFALPKLDSVHIPEYPAEANEHWGAITYSSHYLRKPGKQHNTKDFTTAMTIAHEMSHQWFGNLVTHKWWNDLWLTESFATYFSYKMLDAASPKWHAKERFATDVMNMASFVAETMNQFRHPMTFIPDKLEGPEEKFENVVYEKGAAVIQMLEHILSDQVFQNGIRKYLNKHKFGTVTTDDLLNSLQEAHNESEPTSHLNVKEIMDPWLTQKGHPYLNVTRNYETGVVTITQHDAVYSKSTRKWKIPITFATGSQPNFENTKITYWMEPTADSLEIHGIDKDDWIMLNVQSKDFYQVIYDAENWNRIIAYLNSENYHRIHPFNRAQFLYDSIEQPHTDAYYSDKKIAVIAYLWREINLLPWKLAIDHVSSCVRERKNTPLYEPFRRFGLHLLTNITDRIGLENREDDDDLIRTMRFELWDLACQCGHKKCREAAHAELMKFLRGEIEASTDPSEQHWMYCSGLYSANETIWDMLLNRLPNETFKFLGCTKNHTLINKYLIDALDHPSRNIFKKAVFSILHGPEENYNYLTDFFIDRFDQINEHFNAVNSTLAKDNVNHIIKRLVDNAKTKEHEEKLMKLLNTRGAESLTERLTFNVEYELRLVKRLYVNIKNKTYLKDFFEEHNDV